MQLHFSIATLKPKITTSIDPFMNSRQPLDAQKYPCGCNFSLRHVHAWLADISLMSHGVYLALIIVMVFVPPPIL
jgi:hypothetical protein